MVLPYTNSCLQSIPNFGKAFKTAPTPLKRALYIILVRSKLTYCCQVWRPHLVKDIKLLESVQCTATKWILDDYSNKSQG